MRRELIPIVDEFLSDGSMHDIGRCYDTHYVYSVRKWQNSAKGAIVDWYDINEEIDTEGNSLYVKEGGRHLGHRDSLQFVRSEIDLVRKQETYPGLSDWDMWKQCPLVAEGIVARFVKIDFTDRDYPAMFEAYYEMEKSFYAKERKMTDPNTFNVNLDDEFANDYHLSQEKEKIEFSLKNLLPYLHEEEHTIIRSTAEAYINFVKSKANKTTEPQNEGNRACEKTDNRQNKGNGWRNDNASQKRKKGEQDYSRYSFKLNVNNKKLEHLYVLLSQENVEGKSFIDGDLQKENEATKCLQMDKKVLRDYKPVHIDQMLFNLVFAGIETDVRIVWRADAVELRYFINTLYNYKVNGKRLLEKSGKGPGLMQIVRARFMNGKPRKVFDERTGKKVETSEPIEFEEDAFSHYSKNNTVSNPSVLDAIISKIAPPKDKTDVEEIEEETNPANYGIRPPSEAKQLGEDLRDTSHKGKTNRDY